MKIDELRRIRERASAEKTGREGGPRLEIRVSMGTSGCATGSKDVLQAFRDEVESRDLENHPPLI